MELINIKELVESIAPAGNRTPMAICRHSIAWRTTCIRKTKDTAMSSNPVKNSQPNGNPHPLSIERRSRIRFPLQLRVSYRTLGRGVPCVGEGWVVNMNRGGVLISSEHEVGIGARMELSIEWPSLLYGKVPLRFVTVGTVVRRDASNFALTLARYQFRTAKKKVTAIDSHGDSNAGARGGERTLN
jgi:hypothetical protein